MTGVMNEIMEAKDDVIRKAILMAAQRLFQQYGLAKTTMEDIAKQTGKGKSSLYYYYPNKETIFSAVLEKEKNDVLTELSEIVSKAMTGKEKLRAFGTGRFEALRKRHMLYQIMAEEMSEGRCPKKEVREGYDASELLLIREILEVGISNSEFNISENEVGTTAYIINCALRGLEFNALMRKEPMLESAAAVIEKAVQLLLKAVTRGC